MVFKVETSNFAAFFGFGYVGIPVPPFPLPEPLVSPFPWPTPSGTFGTGGAGVVDAFAVGAPKRTLSGKTAC